VCARMSYQSLRNQRLDCSIQDSSYLPSPLGRNAHPKRYSSSQNSLCRVEITIVSAIRHIGRQPIYRNNYKMYFLKLLSEEVTTIMSSIDSRSLLLLSLKPVQGRIDYNLFNYCAPCEYKLPKDILRCPECKQRVRTKPWHRSKALDMRRI
jgi:hypothetical protein